MEDAYWVKEDTNRNLYIVGTKKDYLVNQTYPIGYYDDGEGITRKGLEEVDEEDWDIKITYL